MKKFTEGDAFGDYRVVRLLGKGGMGEVWLLRSPSGEEVAVKLLDEGPSPDHASRKRFIREAEVAMEVKHPNLVETYDVGEDPDSGLCYIIMEYMPGGTLSDYIKSNGALEIDDAVAIVDAMASVLELAQKKGIVHRDIKPANIMFDLNGTPKLADLGIARRRFADSETTTLTQTGVMIGTPAYMAPEQMLDAHHVDTRADIYSLGIVFYEMLTGERPNKDDTVVQLLARAVKGEPIPDVRTLRPEVSSSLAQLLNMMVLPDRNGRIATPWQITNAIESISSTGRLEVPQDTNRGGSTGRWRRVRIQWRRAWSSISWKVLAAMGVLACAAIMFFVLALIEASSLAPKAAMTVDVSVGESNNLAVAGVKSPPTVESPPIQAVQMVVKTNIVEKIVEKPRIDPQPTTKAIAPASVAAAHSMDTRPQVSSEAFGGTNDVYVLGRTDSLAADAPTVESSQEDSTVHEKNSADTQQDVAEVKEDILNAPPVAVNGKDAPMSAAPPKGVDVEQVEALRHAVDTTKNPTRRVQLTLNALFPGWVVSRNYDQDDRSGFLESKDGEKNVLVTLPCRGSHLELRRRVAVPKSNPVMHVRVSNHSQESQFRMRIRIGEWSVREMDVKDGWTDVYASLAKWSGKTVDVVIEHIPTGWHEEWAYWSKLEVVSDRKAADLAEAQKLEPKPEKFVVSRDLCAKGCLLKDVLPVLLPLWGERPQVNGFLDRSCYYEEYLGRYNVVCLTWRKKLAAACLNGSRKVKLWMQRPILSLTVAGDGNNTYKVRVLDRNKEILSENVVVREWKTFKIDLVDAGTVRDGVYRKAVPLGSLRIEFSPVYGWDGSAFIAGISIEEGE